MEQQEILEIMAWMETLEELHKNQQIKDGIIWKINLENMLFVGWFHHARHLGRKPMGRMFIPSDCSKDDHTKWALGPSANRWSSLSTSLKQQSQIEGPAISKRKSISSIGILALLPSTEIQLTFEACLREKRSYPAGKNHVRSRSSLV